MCKKKFSCLENNYLASLPREFQELFPFLTLEKHLVLKSLISTEGKQLTRLISFEAFAEILVARHAMRHTYLEKLWLSWKDAVITKALPELKCLKL